MATIWGERIYKKCEEAKRAGADILELRADRIMREELEEALSKIKRLSLPLILTLRRRSEGGEMGRERERERLYKEWMEHFCYVDVELLSRIRRSVVKEAKSMGKKIIISYHNFLRTPTQRKLEQIIREAKKGGAEIVKIATVPKNIRQLRRLLLLPHTIKSVPLAIMPMGKFGEWMRIVCVLMGSVLVYGHVGTPIVEGQPPVEWIKRQLSSLR